MTRRRAPQRLLTILRYATSLTLLALLFVFVDLDTVLELLPGVDVTLLLLVVMLQLLDRVLHGWRWVLLLRVKLNDLPVRMLFQVHFISNFLAHFLPFNVGNDLTRVISVAKYSGNTVEPVSSVILDRVIGFAALLFPVALILVAGAIWQLPIIDPAVTWTLTGALAVLALSAFLFWKGGLFDRLLGLAKKRTRTQWLHQIVEVYDACVSYRMYRRALVAVFLILQITVVMGILTTYLTAVALGLDVPIIYCVLFVPLISFLGSLPISANGIGVAEGGFVFFFSQVGVSPAEALTLALVMRVVMIIATLPGAVWLAVEGWPVRPESTSLPTSP